MARRKLPAKLLKRAQCMGKKLKGRKFKNRAEQRKAFKEAFKICST